VDRGESRSIDPRLVRAIAHPLRLTILEFLQARIASARELAAELDESVSRISYHVEVLVECDCLELARSRPRRGFTEHFYKARSRALIGARCTSVVLDRTGVAAANDLLDDFLRGIEAIREQSIERIKDSGQLGIPAIVACAVFEPADAAPVALAPPAE
jgi:DNA-binding transcriptional ArsR family regulator